jgi:two-component system cell cycle response regulator
MPEMNSYEAAQQANTALQDMPVFAVTAFARASARDKALAAGFDGYLAKPIAPESFVEAFLKPDLRLPTPAPAPSAAESYPRLRAEGRTVPVIDNLQANLNLSSSLLEYSGCTAVIAQGTREATASPPDLILSDVCMPEGNGYDSIREIENDHRLASIRFVVYYGRQ